jgi:hypothetical protein
MTRENTIDLSDEELEALDEAREELYGDRDVPYGAVVKMLCSPYTDT